jgi:hypothetical protein
MEGLVNIIGEHSVERLTSRPELAIAVDGRLNVNASFHIGLDGSELLTAPVFFFLTLFPFIIK